MGQRVGEAHSLNIPEMPAHLHHPMQAKAASSSSPGQRSPATKFLAEAISSAQGHPLIQNFSAGSGGLQVGMASNAISSVSGSQPHINQQYPQCLNYIIALQGIFPSQN